MGDEAGSNGKLIHDQGVLTRPARVIVTHQFDVAEDVVAITVRVTDQTVTPVVEATVRMSRDLDATMLRQMIHNAGVAVRQKLRALAIKGDSQCLRAWSPHAVAGACMDLLVLGARAARKESASAPSRSLTMRSVPAGRP